MGLELCSFNVLACFNNNTGAYFGNLYSTNIIFIEMQEKEPDDKQL